MTRSPPLIIGLAIVILGCPAPPSPQPVNPGLFGDPCYGEAPAVLKNCGCHLALRAQSVTLARLDATAQTSLRQCLNANANGSWKTVKYLEAALEACVSTERTLDPTLRDAIAEVAKRTMDLGDSVKRWDACYTLWTKPPSPSAFKGYWTGSFVVESSNDSQPGTLDVAVATDGTISAHMKNHGTTQVAAVTGHIDDSGNFAATYRYDTDPTYSITGVLSRQDAKVSGTFTQTYDGQSLSGTISLDLADGVKTATAVRP